MLSSITPLGQRGRSGSWARTVTGFWVGAIGAASLLFGTLGLVGDATGVSNLPSVALVGVLVAGGLLDGFRIRPVGPHRQVNEDWLLRYRDWVTGIGFGAQLGVGFATIIPSYATWTLYAGALLVGVPGALLVGVCFGAGRSILLLRTRRVTEPRHLALLMHQVSRFEQPAQRAVFASYAAIVALVVVNVA